MPIEYLEKYTTNEEVDMNSNEWQAEIDRQARDYDSQIEDLNAQIQLLERDNARLTAQHTEDTQIIDGLRSRVEGAVSATHDYQQTVHVQMDIIQSFKADLEAKNHLLTQYRLVVQDIVDNIDNCQHVKERIDKLTSLLV